MSWLDSCRNVITESSEWEGISHGIYQELQQILAEDRVGRFSDLSPDEQAAYMNKLEGRLSLSTLYPNFMRKLTAVVDRAVTNAADTIGMELYPNRTRLERILEISSEGAAKLLSDSPESTPEKVLGQLHILKNTSMTPILRKIVWKLALSMPSIRASFEDYQKKRLEILRDDEILIAEKCQSVLMATHPELLSNTALLRTMRTVLSFFDKEVAALRDSHYYVIIPPLVAFIQDNSNELHAPNQVLEFLVALERGSYCIKVGDKEQVHALIEDFSNQLRIKDPELHQVLND